MGNRFGFVSLMDVKNTGDMEKDGEISNRQAETGRPKASNSDVGVSGIRKEVNWNVFAGQASFKDICMGKKDVTRDEKVIVIPNEF
ncbi:hypothetical protein Hanom_Chr10g00888361 [Helianthus anomalus]